MLISLRTFYTGKLFGFLGLFMYVLTIHYLKSIGFAMAFITALSFAIHNNDELNEEFKDVFFGDVIFIIIMCIITPYYTEKQWRDNFLKNRQIEILMKE